MTPKKEPFSEPLPSTPTSSEIPPLFENMVAFTSSPVLEFEAFSAAKTETAPVGGDLYEQNAEFGVFSAGNTETASENAVFGVFSAGSSESALVEATPYRKDAEVDVAVAVPELPRPLECLQGNPIPPFLSKTYDLVDDDSLDPIISWGRSGESFVVWDPLEFARIVLPRNFKHNNFSSFVRQLNTYGFRKIDTDKWEFANEAFRRGQKHLLKTIQRRRATQSQQVGRYVGALTEAGTSGMESELEKLREEKNLLMQEVVELQEEQRGTVHHMEAVNERLQGAEKRQKQMVSFLAKLLHNPEFVARLQQKRDQREIESSRPKRKFIKQHPHGIGKSESPVGEQIVKYESDWRNLAVSCGNPVSNPVLLGSSPDYLLEGMIGAEFTKEDSTFQTENVTSGELALSADFPVTRGFFEQVGEGPSVPRTEGPLFKGKNVVGPQPEVSEEYCTASLCEEFAKERNFPEFSPSSTEVVCKQEDMWNMSFDVTSSMPSSSSQLWGDIPCYDMPDLGATVGMSDVWDFSSLQVSDVLGTDQWPAEASDYDQHEIQAGQSRDDKSKDTSP